MKRLALLCAVICLAVGARAWEFELTPERNMPRDGDALNRALITSGQEGTLVEDGDAPLWDFSRAKYSPCKNKVRYRVGQNNLLFRAQGREQLVFSVRGDTLSLCQHLKPSQRLVYSRPIPLISFNSKDNGHTTGCYYAFGGTDGTNTVRKQGFSSSEVLPPSRLVTPDLDTLDHVLEVRNCRFGAMEISPYSGQSFHEVNPPGDSLITAGLQNDSITYYAETSYWYAAGYRYPIIERNYLKVYNNGLLVDSVCMAYYYSPRIQATELFDEANDTLRTYLAENTVTLRSKAKVRLKKAMSGVEALRAGQDGLSASLSPAITDRSTTFAVNSSLGGPLAIGIYSMSGRLVSVSHHTVESGSTSVPIDVSNLPVGTYLVTGTISGHVFPFKLIRR